MGVPPSWTRAAADSREFSPRNDALFKAFATRRRRLVLAVLLDATEAVSVETLAELVAARDGDADPGTVAVSLPHVEFPILEAAGLVVWSPAGVELTDLFWASDRCRALRQLLDTSYPPDEVDAALGLLADPTCRTVLEQLATYERLSVAELARSVVLDQPLAVATPDRVQRVTLALRHNHVPKLLDVGIVEQADTLHYVGTPVLDEWWPGVAETLSR
ncbi:helix-turn-helix domain-containing protein [Halorarius litoreus]|uniref:helix-turn-helix domain-containing protein n=1 Tax=Halorarius litoreus TaxID=2962676 RepID=UPI0020CD4599|nr:helix-turn-helix domain-containing protein [Halorarius litoreus]